MTGRIPLYFNHDVVFGIVRPAGPMPENRFYRNGIADEMLFVHEGTGVCRTVFGDLVYDPGDYLVLPIGTTWRLDPDPGSGSGSCTSRRRPRSSRRSATATTTGSCSSTRRTGSATSTRPSSASRSTSTATT